jgi:protein gp37
MAENSKIEWCDHTFNPWIGCQKVSPGCDRCYAEAMMDHRYGKVQWGPHGERKRTSSANWRKPLQWSKEAVGIARNKPAWHRRPRVFCASLADWLDNKVPQHWRVDLAWLIDATPELDWLLLTKRPENYHRLSPWREVPANVWLGTTCEDQFNFERRWEALHTIKATVHFISYEPALGPLTLREWFVLPEWIICGGESGHGARVMNPAWARELLDECDRFGVPFFMKQMTSRVSIPPDLMVRQFPEPRA